MIEQVGIAIFGVTAIVFTQVKNDWCNKAAPVIGLAGQPFWLYATFSQDQWGMFALSVCYTAAWALGIKNKWSSYGKR
tara:strand:+ start:4334 stop:4567 length:234 start_codon:yes stop_codon:yes gene_type:complete